MEFTQEELKGIRELIEVTAYPIYNDIAVAKDDLKEIAKTGKEKFGLEKRDFNKMLKLYAEAQYDEEKAKTEQFNSLYEEVFK
jgi:hypothetical protein